jgi:hypothetical protein
LHPESSFAEALPEFTCLWTEGVIGSKHNLISGNSATTTLTLHMNNCPTIPCWFYRRNIWNNQTDAEDLTSSAPIATGYKVLLAATTIIFILLLSFSIGFGFFYHITKA